MKTIYTRKGEEIQVDSDMYEELDKYTWCLNNYGYAWRKKRNNEDYRPSHILLHRQVLGVIDDDVIVDHKDTNRLNCQRDNLRVCNKSENGMNQRLSIRNTSGYKGVSYKKDRGKYSAYIFKNKKKISLGSYDTPEQAGLAYNNKAIELFGEFALLNRIDVS